MLKTIRKHMSRALAWDLQAVPLSEREKARLDKMGLTEPTWQRYAAWRRSLLLLVVGPTLLSAVLATTDTLTEGTDGLSHVGRLFTLLSTLFLWAMPVSALAAAHYWSRLKRSHRWLLAGWGLAFLPPFLLALVPMGWWFELSGTPEEQAGQQFGLAMLDVIEGLYFYCTLMPAALSLLPGLMRACLRVKTLLPAAIVPGWFLVAGAPFSLLLWLVALIALNHLAGDPLLILGVLLWIGTPMLYVARAELFIRPLPPTATAPIGRLQWLAQVLILMALALLVTYVLTKQVFGLRLVGLDMEASLVWLWQNYQKAHLAIGQILSRAKSVVWLGDLDLFQLLLEYVSRSLFLTVVFADLLVRMNLSVWRHVRQFADTAAAANYDRSMMVMDGLLGTGQASGPIEGPQIPGADGPAR